jgi:hypothetical protein
LYGIINIVHNIFIQNFVNCKYYFTVLFLQCMEIIMNVELCYILLNRPFCEFV